MIARSEMLVGPVGKTLFKTIVGLEPLDGGELLGETSPAGIDPDKTLWQVVSAQQVAMLRGMCRHLVSRVQISRSRLVSSPAVSVIACGCRVT